MRKFSPAAAENALARQPWDLLRPLLEGVSDDPAKTIERLRHYARLLFDWNRGVSNLVSHNDEPRLVERHLFESLAPARFLKESGCQRFVDFGSGAGQLDCSGSQAASGWQACGLSAQSIENVAM